VDAGGKIVTCASDTLQWNVGINQIREQHKTIPVSLNLQNQAVATSGDLYQFFIHKGHRYSHIIHPKTGYGIQTPKNVTVIAADGVTADWLSTACSIITIKEALALATKHHAQVFIAMESKGAIRYYHSKGWNRFLH
jgi:thiamine biosynthesis lipoprotein